MRRRVYRDHQKLNAREGEGGLDFLQKKGWSPRLRGIEKSPDRLDRQHGER